VVKRWTAVAVSTFAAVAIVTAPSVANAQGTLSAQGGPQNRAVAINKNDGTNVFRLAFSIDRILSDEAGPGNAAVAYSSCSNCRTTAIAIQVVLLTTTPEGFAPANVAVAVNAGCDSCTTVALAYQIVLQTDGNVQLTKAGRDRIKEILDQLQALEDQDLPPEELKAKADALVDQLTAVFEGELRPVGQARVQRDAAVNQTPEPGFVPPTEPPEPTAGTPTSEPTSTPEPATPSPVPSATP
jgi:putative peptide zinc metalloprotease protein